MSDKLQRAIDEVRGVCEADRIETNMDKLMKYYGTLPPERLLSVVKSLVSVLDPGDIAEEVEDLGL